MTLNQGKKIILPPNPNLIFFSARHVCQMIIPMNNVHWLSTLRVKLKVILIYKISMHCKNVSSRKQFKPCKY